MSTSPGSAPITSEEFSGWMHTLSSAPPLSLAVAVSGGADSMALALLAAHWATSHNIALTALTVDHHLRESSEAEAHQVAEWMQASGIPHHILHWHGGNDAGNLQANARDARYRLMAEYCISHGIPRLLVAHHADDQAETVLMRIKRGSHIEGLAAIRPIHSHYGIILMRPLLGCPKSRLIATLNARHHTWIEDPTNNLVRFDRNRLRMQLATLPNKNSIILQLAHTAHQLDHIRTEREAETKQWLDTHALPLPNGWRFSSDTFLLLPQDLAFRVLSHTLVKISGAPHPPRFMELERLYAALVDGTRQRIRRTLLNCLITRAKGELHICHENSLKRSESG